MSGERCVDLVVDGVLVRVLSRDLSPSTRLALVDLVREVRKALAAPAGDLSSSSGFVNSAAPLAAPADGSA
jgi:hypothetical protein